jgi:hypothetical protein
MRHGGRNGSGSQQTVHQLAPDSFCSPRSDCLLQHAESLASTQINTRTPDEHSPPAQRPSSSFNMQTAMSPVPVPIPIPMLPRSAGAQTAMATRSSVRSLVAPLLRRPSAPSLHAPAPQRLVRHATAPEPRACMPHPLRNKRKASFQELSPEVAERPSKRPKIDQDNSGKVANHVAVSGSSRN